MSQEPAVFFDPAECIPVAVEAAKSRNKLAVRARLAGDEVGARNQQGKADWYISRARIWLNMIEGEATNG